MPEVAGPYRGASLAKLVIDGDLDFTHQSMLSMHARLGSAVVTPAQIPETTAPPSRRTTGVTQGTNNAEGQGEFCGRDSRERGC